MRKNSIDFWLLWVFSGFLCWGPPQAQSVWAQQTTEERLFSEPSLKSYRENPDYQYYREKPQSLEPKEDPEEKKSRIVKRRIPKPRGDYSETLKVIIGLIMACLLGYVVYQAFKVNWRDLWKKKSDKALVDLPKPEDDPDDIRDLEFEKLLQAAIAEKRYRHAIRLLYLNTLRQLQEQGLIQWKKGKTNHAYWREIKHENLKSAFGEILLLFEYTWYGEFQVDAAHFEIARSRFDAYDALIRRKHAD